MPSSQHFEHDQLIQRGKILSLAPEKCAYESWLQATLHLDYLRQDVVEDELTVHAIGQRMFILTAVVSENDLNPLDKDDLLNWNCLPPSTRAGYEWGFDNDGVELHRDMYSWGVRTLNRAYPLVFYRDHESGAYCDIWQEYLHLNDIHWDENRSAYCRLDKKGDWEHVVSVTHGQGELNPTLVSFRRQPLDEFLTVSRSVLIRMFDFMLLQNPCVGGWTHENPVKVIVESPSFFYRQQIDDGQASWTRGIQIVRPNSKQSRGEIFASIRGESRREYAEFIVWDWRNNNKEATVSAAPEAITNYFTCRSNSLPFETSPAFFDPEVLLRFKNDRSKYALSSSRIECRGAWSLRYHVNEARQIQVYIKVLQGLSYEEQSYWKRFNEKCKGGISQKAHVQDFLGEWREVTTPLEDLFGILQEWINDDVGWWKIGDQISFNRVHTPLTDSQDEWESAFQNLATLVVGGFKPKFIRAILDEKSIALEPKRKGQSLYLLETLLPSVCETGHFQQLPALRDIQKIRSKISVHDGGQVARDLMRQIEHEHRTLADHFEAVCRQANGELRLIEQVCSSSDDSG